MYPYELLPGVDMYVIMLCLGVISAILVFRVLSDKIKLDSRLHNLCLYTAVAAFVVGYYSAVFFQALYNIPKYGKFVLNAQTGATFYGGLIGGAASFLLIYFVAGRFVFRSESVHKRCFIAVSDIAAPCIAIAHGLGRIGCLFAGCCHGKVTEAWYGICMVATQKKVVPIQLFEAIFLFALFALLTYRVLKGKTFGLPIYMGVYGVWRFFIEYARNDYRGHTFVSFLTPSQLTAVAMVLGAVALFIFEKWYLKRHSDSALATEEES